MRVSGKRIPDRGNSQYKGPEGAPSRRWVMGLRSGQVTETQ